MFYPWYGHQSIVQWLLNTLDPRVWFRDKDCECAWHDFQGKITWIPLAGCPKHD